ncbi:MAG TPA: glycosyltransferase family 39 protein [Gammaproteobacteria bacterium]|nr:glycosyltransferase family 39 protein [Gammaproteobacteria bacterium]
MTIDLRCAAESLAFFCLAFAIRLVHLDHAGFYDEFYHVLAAGSMLGDNSGLTGDFSYGRAPQFTWLVAVFQQLFGQDLVAARLPSVIAGSATVMVLYLLVSPAAGPVAGRVSALLLCFDPDALFLSQISRFYAVHGLAFLLGSTALYLAMRGPPRSWTTAAYAITAAALLVFSAQLTPITSVGVAALALWAATETDWRMLPSLAGGKKLALLLLLLVSVIAIINIIPFGHLAAYYQSTPLFLEGFRTSRGYYVDRLLGYYPLLLGLLPLATVIGLNHFRRLTWFCAVVFACVLLVHSAAAAKQMRYIAYTMPYMYAILGLATAAGWQYLKKLSRQAVMTVPPTRWAPASWMNAIALLLAAGILLFMAYANNGYRISLGMLRASAADWPQHYRSHQPSDWDAATPRLSDLASAADVLISSAGIKALFYLNRLDYDLLLTLRNETTTGQEFGLDYRTGRPVISSAKSLADIMSRNASGLIVIDEVHWRRESFVPDETAGFIEENMQRLDTPDQWHLRVYRWPPAEQPPS